MFEIAAAFTQLQRDESGDGEHPGAFLDRVGVRYVANRIVMNAEERAVLLARFMRTHRPRQSLTRSDDIVLALLGEARARTP